MNVYYEHHQSPLESVLPPGTCVAQPKAEKVSKTDAKLCNEFLIHRNTSPNTRALKLHCWQCNCRFFSVIPFPTTHDFVKKGALRVTQLGSPQQLHGGEDPDAGSGPSSALGPAPTCRLGCADNKIILKRKHWILIFLIKVLNFSSSF